MSSTISFDFTDVTGLQPMDVDSPDYSKCPPTPPMPRSPQYERYGLKPPDAPESPVYSRMESPVYSRMESPTYSRIDESDEPSKNKKKRITRNIMTLYEHCQILGARATLLAKGAPPLIDPEGERDPLVIAQLELEANILPIIIKRYLPNGKYEEWRIQELKPYKK